VPGLAVIVGLLVSVAPAHANVYTVGADMACSSSTLAGALLSAAFHAGADEIHISGNQSYTNEYLHLTDWDPSSAGALTIVGGYDNCSDPTPGGRTAIDGQAGSPTVEIDTSSATSMVTLRNLEIIGSGSNGVLVQGDSTVSIENCYIRNNGSSGVRAETGTDVSIDYTTSIRLNDSTLGGGLYCDGSTVTLEGIIRENTATSSGGGIFATGNCQVTVNPGGYIELNEAQWGGGIYATGGADVFLYGTSATRETKVFNNTATNSGGGIYASSVGTTVEVNNARATYNVATNFGGGVFAANSATVEFDRIARTCVDTHRCVQLSHNSLTTAGEGAAAYVESGAVVTLNQTWIESNSGPTNLGFLLFATGSSSLLRLDGAQIWDNGTISILQGENQAQITAAFVTTANNRNNIPSESRLLQLNTNATASLYSSILRETSGTALASGGAVTIGDCLMLDALADVPGASFSSTADPMFRGRSYGDLRPMTQSPAIDYCDESNYVANQFDLDHTPRGYDRIDKTNVYGTIDLGAFEVTSFFYGGFEEGNTSGWSSSVP
jgi:predicted outer membrane repeat protein